MNTLQIKTLSENHILKGLKHMETGAMNGQTLEYLLEMYLEEWGKIEIRGRWEEENRNKPIEVRNYKDKPQANKKKYKHPKVQNKIHNTYIHQYKWTPTTRVGA